MKEIINLWEMANLRPNRSGLPVCVWVQEFSGKEGHFARIKVSTNYGDKINLEDGFFTITVPEKKIIGTTGKIKNKDIELIKKFVDANTDIIIQLWNKDIDIGDFLTLIKKV